MLPAAILKLGHAALERMTELARLHRETAASAERIAARLRGREPDLGNVSTTAPAAPPAPRKIVRVQVGESDNERER